MLLKCKGISEMADLLKAEEPLSHYYTFGQNNYTRRPLAHTNDLKS